MEKRQTVYEKALEINLDPSIYGVFAEIGAGQETANCFFRVSASAGTVAKTISAYDMVMSDALYGKTERYVSQERLQSMLRYEFDLLVERLGKTKGDASTFFAFCNTVRAKGYQDDGECHGWLGVRFQIKPNDKPCEIRIHIRLLDQNNPDQMEALGKIGVNLIYAAFKYRDDLKLFAESLVDDISPNRIEVDLLRFEEEPFRFIDNRLCALQLVESNLTEASLFNPSGEVVQPLDILYKRPILLLRGSFNPVLKLHLDMLEQSKRVFFKELDRAEQERSIEICEISTNNLLRDGLLDHGDFIDRADAIQALGKSVLISRSAEFHRIATYLNRCSNQSIGIVLSIGILNELFKEKWSEDLAGGMLESFGRLFKNKVNLYVYPWHNITSGELVTADNFKAPKNWELFYRHLRDNQRICAVGTGNPSLLAKTSRTVLRQIEAGDLDWKNWVPLEAQAIVERHNALN
jgi:hypothetical protein